ncbi:Uncharacterized membrane protein YheB, UPF0754 family [Caloramator quimbayensis]|uniref:Uncharacterized membrane protein YheB, UPF0754 family n=1 Tax=Caloramator quimbayensis TaxID=1147123 RepID=A0A1T4X5R9_9CLOT|nr:DUF445 family protein [Caloramator quimbayensis]SKA84777.1 Uncharacterized membrane protein YheB, UPF0754 family [Caloramator quimbayensis]
MKFIIPALVGALIGYITNYLAIKMLFRPYEEVKILGFKIPFTPGLIPKEKNRIAKSVGEAVGVHLLTSDTIVETLFSERVNDEIKSYIEKKLLFIKQSNKKIKDVLGKYNVKCENIKFSISKRLSEFILKTIKKNYTRDKIGFLVENFIVNKFDYIINSSFFDKALTNINIIIEKAIDKSKNYLKFKAVQWTNGLKNDERMVIQIIPSDIINNIKILISQNSDKQAEFLIDIISRQDTREEIKKNISSIIEQNFGKFVTMLISADYVSEKILLSIESFLRDTKNHSKISDLILDAFDKVLEIKISNLMSFVSDETNIKLVDEVVEKISDFALNEESKNVIKETLREIIASNKQEIGTGFKDAICDIIERQIESLEFENLLNKLTVYIVDYIFNISLSDLFADVNISMISKFTDFLRENFGEFIKDKAATIVELIDIPSMVESRINSFDAQFAEKVIIEVANKELKAITWLGALLGGIMGILTPFLNSLINK